MLLFSAVIGIELLFYYNIQDTTRTQGVSSCFMFQLHCIFYILRARIPNILKQLGAMGYTRMCYALHCMRLCATYVPLAAMKRMKRELAAFS